MTSLPSLINIIPGKNQPEKTYLKVKLENNIRGLIPVKQTKEAIIVPAKKVTIMPNVAKSFIGLFNQRNHVFWLVDLSNLLQLSCIETKQQEYSVVILQVENISLGLVVKKIQEVIKFPDDKIQSSIGNHQSSFTPYVKGCLIQNPDEILLILDSQRIIKTITQVMLNV